MLVIIIFTNHLYNITEHNILYDNCIRFIDESRSLE